MTLVYSANIKQVTNDWQEAFLNRLPFRMQNKFHAFRKEADATRFLLGKALLMEGFKKFGMTQESLDDLRFTEFNKPYMEDSIFFNISHSGDYVLCAFSEEGPVGVDVEYVQTIDLNVFSRVLSGKEKCRLLENENRTSFFYYLWTRKEAVAKADSRGTSVVMNDLDVLEDEVMVPPRKWHLATVVLPDNYMAHVATTTRIDRPVIPKLIMLKEENDMLIANPTLRITDLTTTLISLESSTTLYLERVKNKKLKVWIETQEQAMDVIQRATRLYFSSSELPSLYCISHLEAAMLSPEERCLILHSEMPLGLIFLQNNPPAIIRKKNLETVEEDNADVARRLQIDSSLLYRKSYEYWIGDRNIGTIIEFFNEETLQRI